jgi:hypothetical protein
VPKHDENPLFGETATHVLLDDDSAGAYIVLKQVNEYSKEGEVRLNMDELELVVKAARELIENYPDFLAE